MSTMKEIVEEITTSHKEREEDLKKIGEEVKEIKKEARNLINEFQMQREMERKSKVKEMLNNFKESLGENSAQLRKELEEGAAKRSSEVKSMLEKFKADRKKSGENSKKELSKENSNLRSDVKKMLKDFQSDLEKTAREVREMRNQTHVFQSEIRANVNEDLSAWDELIGIERKKGVAEKGKQVEKEIVRETMVEEEPDLETKLLETVTSHPYGITLAEAGEIIGVAPVVLGKTVKKLIEEEKIHKEEKLYFPIITE
jgi:hypothetical protein